MGKACHHTSPPSYFPRSPGRDHGGTAPQSGSVQEVGRRVPAPVENVTEPVHRWGLELHLDRCGLVPAGVLWHRLLVTNS